MHPRANDRLDFGPTSNNSNMGKQTKRSRKFNASGGVKDRIEKGTITKHGKLRKRKGKKRPAAEHRYDGAAAAGGGGSKKRAVAEEHAPPRERADDFLGRQNLGDLDMEAFFSITAASIEAGGGDEEAGHSDSEAEEESSSVSEDESSDSEDDQTEQKEVENKPSDRTKSTEKKEGSSSNSSSSSSDDSNAEEEEDIEAAEAQMKAEMENLKQSDPDFHKFLKENEESLLEFGKKDAGEQGVDDDHMDVAEAGTDDKEADGKGDRSSDSAVHLTPKLLKSLAEGTFDRHSVKSLKKLVSAYRSACYLADSGAKSRPGESGKNYVIDSPKVFDDLLVMCLKRCHEEFRYHLLENMSAERHTDESFEDEEDQVVDELNKPLNPKMLEKASSWSSLRLILLSFFRSTLHMITEGKEPELLTFVLKALANYVRLLTPFPRVAESLLKTLVALWSAPLDTAQDYQVVRLQAFFRIRQLALTQPFPFVEVCLKKTYLAYAKRAKFGNASSVSVQPTLTFMGNCLVELYSLDYHSSYQHAFVYIRQLALLLRGAMQKKTSEAMQQVYCWQYVHCLKLWVAVLSACAAAEDSDASLMKSLVYPLVEIIMGCARLIPAPVRHLPLTFHYVRLLQQLAASSETFIPTTSLLLDCLDWKEWTMHPKKATKRNSGPWQLSILLKFPKEDPLRTHEQLDASISEFFVLLHREIELYRYSAGFPEFSLRITSRLRRFAKDVSNQRWHSLAKACVAVCEQHSQAVVQARAQLQEAPKDVKRLECCKPASVPPMRVRHEEAITKERKSFERHQQQAKSNKDESEDEDSSNEEMEERTKRKKNKAKEQRSQAAASNEMKRAKLLNDDELMEAQDEVQEGIDWSDDDED